jgi:hypothetical protein
MHGIHGIKIIRGIKKKVHFVSYLLLPLMKFAKFVLNVSSICLLMSEYFGLTTWQLAKNLRTDSH